MKKPIFFLYFQFFSAGKFNWDKVRSTDRMSKLTFFTLKAVNSFLLNSFNHWFFKSDYSSLRALFSSSLRQRNHNVSKKIVAKQNKNCQFPLRIHFNDKFMIFCYQKCYLNKDVFSICSKDPVFFKELWLITL